MLTSEKEARTKWCRHVRAPLAKAAASADQGSNPISGTVSNRYLDFAPSCLASDCMAWGWYDGPPTPTDDPEQRRGYCRAEPVAPWDVPDQVLIAPPDLDYEAVRAMAAKIIDNADLARAAIKARGDEIRRGARRGPKGGFKP